MEAASNVVNMESSLRAIVRGWSSGAMETGAGWLFITTITPDRAQRLLAALPERQRKASQNHVRRIADDMVSGRWKANGDVIRIGTDGHLWDGQHRLNAVIESGFVLRNYGVLFMNEEDAELTVDTGTMPRTPQHIVKMHGDAAVGMTGARAAALIYEHCDFMENRVHRMSKLARHEIVVNSDRKEFLKRLPHKANKGLLAAAIRCSRVDEQASTAFFGGVLNSDPIVNGRYSKAANALSTWVLQVRGTGAGLSFTRESTHRALRLWNAWRDGSEGRMKQLPKYYGNSHDFPTPV